MSIKVETIAVIDLREKHIGDFQYISVTATETVFNRDSSGGSYYYDESTASFVTSGTGTLFSVDSAQSVSVIFSDSAATVNARMRTVEIDPGTTEELVVDDLFIRTEPSISNLTVIKHTDGFNNYDTSGVDTIRLYNDLREVNLDDTVVARMGGTRNSLVHEYIPIGSDMVQSVSIELQAEDEATILDLKIIPSDQEQGGDR